MANPARGEVDLVSESKTYTLFVSTNAVCELEKRTGKTYGQVLHSLVDVDVNNFRELLWAMLKKHHRREFVNESQIGELIDDVGRDTVMAALTELFRLNLPPKDDAEQTNGAGGDGHRPRGAAGTGDSSTSTSGSTG